MSRNDQRQQGQGAARQQTLAGNDAPAASSPLQSGADRALIRVELLRVAHRADLTAGQIVERAKTFEDYVFDGQPADKP